MHLNYYLFPLVVAFALSMSSSVKAAEPLALHNTSFAELKQQFQFSLPGNKNISNSMDSLRWVRQDVDSNKVTHIRLQQYYAGVPVFGGYAIMHSKSNPTLKMTNAADVRMNGVVYRGLQAELGQPKLSLQSQKQGLLQAFKKQYMGQKVGEERIVPVIYIDKHHQAHWAYKVSVLVIYDDKIPERPTAIVDAQTNKSFVRWNDVKTEFALVKGTGFGGNHKVGEYQYGKEYPLLSFMRNAATGMCFLENIEVKVVDMGHKYYSNNKPMSFTCTTSPDSSSDVYFTGYSSDGYDRANGAASPTNDALYSGYVIKHMYEDWYGIPVLTRTDSTPMQLIMRVHYGDGYENAYWDGKQMTFGDGDHLMYPLVSLGVAAHEISHGFTEQHSSLEYFGQSGGMNEAFSDMAAQAAEFYANNKNDWKIGAEVMKEDSGMEVMRYMDVPSRDRMSIDSAADYYGGMDVHHSSGVYNRLFYLLSTQPNWTLRKAFDVMVKANMNYWTPYSTFDEGGCGILSATQDLGFSLDDVKQSLSEVAINYQSCFNEDDKEIN